MEPKWWTCRRCRRCIQMCGNLEQYEDAEFWAAHRNVFFQTEKGMEEYTVVSVLKTDIRKFPFTKTQFPDEASLKEYAELAKSQEVFENSRAVRVQYCICMERLVRHDFKSLDNYLDTY